MGEGAARATQWAPIDHAHCLPARPLAPATGRPSGGDCARRCRPQSSSLNNADGALIAPLAPLRARPLGPACSTGAQPTQPSPGRAERTRRPGLADSPLQSSVYGSQTKRLRVIYWRCKQMRPVRRLIYARANDSQRLLLLPVRWSRRWRPRQQYPRARRIRASQPLANISTSSQRRRWRS